MQGRFDEFEARIKQLESEAAQSGERAGSALGGAFTTGLKIATAGAVALAGAVIAIGVSTFNLAQEAAQNVQEFQSKLGASREEAEKLGSVAEAVFGNNWVESLSAAGDAVAAARKEIKGLTDDELQRVTEGTIAITQTFEQEQPKVAAAVQAVMKATGLSAQEATDFITAGFQRGLDSSGDFLDTLLEYSPQFEKAKISGDGLFSLLETGAAKGALGTDKIADAFKEFTLTVVEVSDASTEAYAELGLSHSKIVADINSGKITAAEAFQTVIGKLQDVKGVANQTRLFAAISGGGGEDLAAGLAGIDLTKTKVRDLQGSTESLNRRYENLGQFVEGMWRKIQVALLPVGKELLGMANEAVPYLQRAFDKVGAVLPGLIRQGIDAAKQFGTTAVNVYNNVRPVIESTVQTVEKLSAFLNRNKEILIPLTAAVGAGAAAFGAYRLGVAAVSLAMTIWTAAQTAAAAASVALRAGLTFLTGPVGLVITAITLLVGAGVALYRNWDEVKAFAEKTWGRIKEIVAGALKSASDYLGSIDWKDLGLNVVQGLVNGILAGPRLVLAAARGLGTAVINGIKGVLNIQSPSRVMKELDEFTSQGFVQGLDAERPSVRAAAQATAKSFIDAFADLKAEKAVGNVDLSAYTKTLESAAAQLRAKLKTVKEGTPAYTEWLKALGAVTTELDGLKSKSSGAQASAKDLADQLAQNRKQIEQGEAMERYVAGLRSATDAQLKTALATAKSGGETERYNAIRDEQRRREEAVTQAQDRATDAARRASQQLADNRAQIAAGEAQERYVKGLRSATDAQLATALATARAAGDTEKYNLVKAEQGRRLDATTAAHDKATAATQRETQALRDGQAAIREARDYDAYLGSLHDLTDAELALEAARQEAAGHQQQYNDVLSEQARRAGDAAQAVSDLVDQQLRAASVRFTDTQAVNDSAYRQSYGAGDEGLISAIRTIGGLDPATVAADVDAALADLERFNKNAAAAIRSAWATELQARRDQVAEEVVLLTMQGDANKGLADEVVAEADKLAKDGKWRETFGVIEKALGSLYDRSRDGQNASQGIDALTLALNRLADARSKLSRDDMALSEFRDLVASGVQDPMSGSVDARGMRGKVVPVVASAPRVDPDVDKAWDDFRRKLADTSGLKATAEGLKLLDDTQLAAAKSAAVARKDVAAFSAVLTEEERRTKEAEAAQKKWADNLDRISDATWVAGLKDLSDAQLQVGLDAARAAKDTDQFNAYLVEQKRRTDESAAAQKKWADNLDRISDATWVAGLKDLSDAQLQVGLDAARAAKDTDKFNAYLTEQKRRTDEASKNLDTLSDARQKLTEVQAGGARPFAAELAALEAMRGKPGVIASELDALIKKYRELQAETERKKGLETRINEWGKYAQQIIPVVTGAMQALGGASDEVAGQWASDLGNMVEDLVNFGTAIAKGDYLGAAIQALTSIFNWFSRNKKAAEEAAKATREYNEQFRFAAGTSGDNYGTRTTGSYTTGFLFWSTTHYTEQIDTMKRDVALALEGGFVNGITEGFTQALAANDFGVFEKSLKTSVGKSVLAGLVDAFLNKEAIARIIGPALEEFQRTGNRQVLRDAVSQVSAEAEVYYNDVLKPVSEAFGLGEGAASPAAGSLAAAQADLARLRTAFDNAATQAERDELRRQITDLETKIKTMQGEVAATTTTATTAAPSTSSTIKIEAPTITSTIRFDVLETMNTTVGQLAAGMPAWLNQMSASGRDHLEAGGRQLAAVGRLERLLDRKETDWGALR